VTRIGPSGAADVAAAVLEGAPHVLRVIGFEEGGPFSAQDSGIHGRNHGTGSAEYRVDIVTADGTFKAEEGTIAPGSFDEMLEGFTLKDGDQILVTLKKESAAGALLDVFANSAEVPEGNVQRTSVEVGDEWTDVLAPQNGQIYVPMGQEETGTIQTVAAGAAGATVDIRFVDADGIVYPIVEGAVIPASEIVSDLEEAVFAVKPKAGEKYQARVTAGGPAYLYLVYMISPSS
jgi:hypothetical protein